MKDLCLNQEQEITLGILQQMKQGQYLKIKDVAKRSPDKFIEIVKSLIDIGYCEYEFTNDYKEVRRMSLPDFAKDYFTKLSHEYEQTKKDNQRSVEETPIIQRR